MWFFFGWVHELFRYGVYFLLSKSVSYEQLICISVYVYVVLEAWTHDFKWPWVSFKISWKFVQSPHLPPMHLTMTFNFNFFIYEYPGMSEFFKHILRVFIEVYPLMFILINWMHKWKVFFHFIFMHDFYQTKFSKFFLLLMQESLLLLSGRWTCQEV